VFAAGLIAGLIRSTNLPDSTNRRLVPTRSVERRSSEIWVDLISKAIQKNAQH
jgi:hypothetical protein